MNFSCPQTSDRKALRRRATILHPVLLCLICLSIAGCAANLPERPIENRHLTAPKTKAPDSIPEVVQAPPLVTKPKPEARLEVYSVVVYDVPVRELLFTLARDASLNIDVNPGVEGNVTLNAVDQTLPQILSRIARQVPIRWDLAPPNLIVEPDTPILRTYRIDYVNIARKSEGEVNVSTSISTAGPTTVGAGSGGGAAGAGFDNNSTTRLKQHSDNTFWATLIANLRAIVGEAGAEPAGGDGGQQGAGSTSGNVIANPESGLVTVRATSRQHEEIQKYLDLLQLRALQQVLIEATVVEVRLNDQYQTGINWDILEEHGTSFSYVQDLTGVNLIKPPVTTMTIDASDDPDRLVSSIKLLEEFGDLQVLSSPKLMVLNNQTAMLKVVDNKVYFTIEVTPGTPATATSPATQPTYTSTIHTVPIGFVMAVTPQVSESNQVTLNVRPTISRIIGYVADPSPALAEYEISSLIPEVQVREVESVLKVASGQIGVLGGLMQDTMDKTSQGLPGFSRMPVVGELFRYRDDTARKTELVIFLRPVVIHQASLSKDLRDYEQFLPNPDFIPAQPLPFKKKSGAQKP